MDAAELLLALAADPARPWRVDELIAKLAPATALNEADAQRYLEQFQAAGVAAAAGDARYRYQPADPKLDAHVAMLARAYNERPVTLFRGIYALRDLQLQSFADAFKLKRK